MRNALLVIIGILLAALYLTACGSSGAVPPPSNFDKMTATVEGADGAPLSGLAVRVEGHDTGITTDASGGFVLTSGNFPRGVNVENEISLGRNGVVVGTQTVVPVNTPVLNIKFGDPTVGDPGSISGNIFNGESGDPLDGVQVTAFSDAGGVLETTSSSGKYSFAAVAPGAWQISAYADGFAPKTAMVRVEAGQDVVQHLALTPKGTIGTGEGLKVKGVLRDADTGDPVSGATVTMYADTGYYGAPEPAVMTDVQDWNSSGEAVMGYAGAPGMTTSSLMPFIYDPSYQETITDAAGNFEFPDEVVAYSIWLNFYADGYLNGNDYEYVDGMTGVKNLELTIQPYVATSVSGTVVDENGDPVEGAYIEYIFNGYGTEPLPVAVPGGVGWEDIAADGQALAQDFGAPPPPQSSGGAEENYQSWGDAEAVMPAAGAMGDVGTDGYFGGPDMDNELMMRFRYQHQESSKSGSAADFFDGYYSATTGADGTYAIADMPAGSYYVIASAYRHIPYDNNIDLSENPDDNVVDITLPNIPVGSVEGVILDDQGVPVPDVLVNATQPFVDPFTYSDNTGHYRIDNVPAGSWNIGAYKKGYLTTSQMTDITDGGVATVNLTIQNYEPPAPTLITYSGHVVNGTDNSMVAGADLVFTPVNDEYGGYFQHVSSDANGGFAAQLIPTEYNVLIQKDGYEDLYMRIWVDSLYPQMDFWLWPVGTGRGGPWGGVVGVDTGLMAAPESMPDMPPPNEF